MMKSIKTWILVVLASSLLVACGQGGGGSGSKKSKTLDNTKKAGFVKCGVSQGLPGFSNADEAGDWTGIDVDVCRAVGAAVLGDGDSSKGYTLRIYYKPLVSLIWMGALLMAVGGVFSLIANYKKRQIHQNI